MNRVNPLFYYEIIKISADFMKYAGVFELRK